MLSRETGHGMDVNGTYKSIIGDGRRASWEGVLSVAGKCQLISYLQIRMSLSGRLRVGAQSWNVIINLLRVLI